MAIDAIATIDLWDRAQGLSPMARSVQLAAEAGSELDPEMVALLPVGERDRLLLRLRSQWSRADLVSTTDCPECQVTNELVCDLHQLMDAPRRGDIEPMEIEERIVTWRPVNSLDLQAAAATMTQIEAEQVLLRRCVVEVTAEGRQVEGHAPSRGERSALAAAIDEADPLAEVLLDVKCVECGHRFVSELDIAEIVWAELAGMARRLLADVDMLAKAYGWTESDCLSLSPARRAWYLEMATG